MFYAKQQKVTDEQLLEDAICIAAFHQEEEVRRYASLFAWSIVGALVKAEKEKNAKDQSN